MWYAARQGSTSGASSSLHSPLQFLPQSWGVAVTFKPEPTRPTKQLGLVVRSPSQTLNLLIHCGKSLGLFSHLQSADNDLKGKRICHPKIWSKDSFRMAIFKKLQMQEKL